MVSYAKQTYDSPNPIVRYAHRTRYKISLDLAKKLLPVSGKFIDFGAGNGAFLHRFSQIRPDADLTGIEPYMSIDYPDVRRVPDLGSVEPASVDLVSAFEVLEHLGDDDLARFFDNARRALRPGGHLLVTVPIMYGLTLPIKEVSRSLLHRRFSDHSLMEIAKGTAGLQVARAHDRRPSHKGFDFRDLEKQISEKFKIEIKNFSPFASLPWYLNSQAIYIAS
ncbi:bifunctional 2-polyprenyl-6-hydroxyphenol methylase/3-demethylubiquinol 3-O-methyltransferase UbiG [Novosphingobium sp. Chol11]|uniref:class I SAM-dependent methyltransferase n=1 Tax=Novosphingobium sp. Chol11 TaxID=1385763 RepID=UPI0025EB19B5|nr:class I SAM-dependent methyltransferase [Novosphingobium sp. Chol11]